MNAFWTGLVAAIVPFIVPIAVALGTILTMWYLSKQKKNLAVVQSALQILHMLFGDKLGAQAGKVFDIWLDCLQKVQSGEWTEDQMIAEFFQIIAAMQQVNLSENDKQNFIDITKASVKSFAENNVKVASIKR